MKNLILALVSTFLTCLHAYAQLYINGAVTIQNGATLYADDTIQQGSSASLTTNGLLQSTKGVNTNQYLINTGTTGFILTPVAPGSTRSFDIGTTTNNRISIQHSSAGAVTFKLAARDNVYVNPQTGTGLVSTNAVGKTWYVEPLSSITGTVIGLYWNAADELSSFSRANSGMGKWQSGATSSWSFVNGTAAATNTGSSPAYAKTVTVGAMSTGIFYFGIGGAGSALPVQLVSFSAGKLNGDVLLKWETSSEINTNHFEIERSADAVHFATIEAVAASGTGNAPTGYVYRDAQAFSIAGASKIYYRLRAVDNDGSASYTGVKTVTKNDAGLDGFTVTIFPNPVSGIAHILMQTIGSTAVYVTLYDMKGQQVLEKTETFSSDRTEAQLAVSHLPPGVYMLYVHQQNGDPITRQKLVIY